MTFISPETEAEKFTVRSSGRLGFGLLFIFLSLFLSLFGNAFIMIQLTVYGTCLLALDHAADKCLTFGQPKRAITKFNFNVARALSVLGFMFFFECLLVRLRYLKF